MKIKRMDLDGTGSPMGLVTKILKIEKDLPIPVPIEELARQLDIEKVADLETPGFEGGLVTDAERSTGFILVNDEARDGRRRFTIGHELGHFLIISHTPVEPEKFLCSRADMATWSAEQNDRHARMEAEANDFSALILMPPPVLQKFISKERDPNLAHIPLVAKHFCVSKEAAARSYARYHDQNIAIAVLKDGIVRRIHKGPRFPWTTARYGKPAPQGSIAHRKDLTKRIASEIVSTLPNNWIDVQFGQPAPELYEQVYPQQDGYALLMLWAELPEKDEEFDPDDNRTSKQRLQYRQSKWR
ncbi:MAG TPA: ImmA/IrrE family metallo-endopeptidase [Xanthobacteraceae bacterium]|nr:ImmA/IrrE family metallo-endopeptidase [Xanthobacteraceae bacterium]